MNARHGIAVLLLATTGASAQAELEAARRKAVCLSPDERAAIGKEMDRVTQEVMGPRLETYRLKTVAATDATDAARKVYIACVQGAQRREASLPEACAADKAAFDQRSAEANALSSPDRFQREIEDGMAAAAPAIIAIGARIPECPNALAPK